MKNIFSNILYLIVGLVIGYFIRYATAYNNIQVIDNKQIVVDTVVHKVAVKVPMHTKTRYVYVIDTVTEVVSSIDSVAYEVRVNVPDSTKLAVNTYTGNEIIGDSDGNLHYDIEVLGNLLSFKPTVELYNKVHVYRKPKWTVSGALSNRGNFKVGLGYKAVLVETEFSDRVNQVFLGLQYKF